jgi:hypothetical protein
MRSKLASSRTSQSKSCSIAILAAAAVPGASSTARSALLRTLASCSMANIPTKESSLLVGQKPKLQTRSKSPTTSTSGQKAKPSSRPPSQVDQSLLLYTLRLSPSSITATESSTSMPTIAQPPMITAFLPSAMEQKTVSSTISLRTRGAQIGERVASSESQPMETALASAEFSSMGPTQSLNENDNESIQINLNKLFEF